jgi:soluble lytic murein transglycosylase-like protein
MFASTVGGTVPKFPAFLMAMLVATTAAAAGHADVYEIDDQGAVLSRHQSGSVVWVSPDPNSATAADDLTVPATAMTMITPPKVPDAWRASLLTAADRYGVSSDLLAALVWQESRWHASAVSPKGATGLTQLMPATARALAVNARDPAANLAGGAQYLRRMLDMFDGNVERALAAYNAGPGRVQRANGIPAIAETRSYVSDILLRLTPADAGQTGF